MLAFRAVVVLENIRAPSYRLPEHLGKQNETIYVDFPVSTSSWLIYLIILIVSFKRFSLCLSGYEIAHTSFGRQRTYSILTSNKINRFKKPPSIVSISEPFHKLKNVILPAEVYTLSSLIGRRIIGFQYMYE